jgi:hypothetical protein
MKPGIRDNAGGNMHQVKGTIMKSAGRIVINKDLKGEGKDKIFILELLIDAGFISQRDIERFQVMTAFGNFKVGDITKVRVN